MTQHPPPDFPEIPYPFPPHREPPGHHEPIPVPTVALPSDDVRHQLFERRTLFVSGVLDRNSVSALCAELMALDARGDDPVELVVNSEGGPLGELSPVLDVIDLMRASVNTTCVGMARGTAGILVACGTGTRRAGPNAIISVRCDRSESIQGSASEIAHQAEQLAAMRRRLEQALTDVTGQTTETIAEELETGPMHDGQAALRLGLVDELVPSRRGR